MKFCSNLVAKNVMILCLLLSISSLSIADEKYKGHKGDMSFFEVVKHRRSVRNFKSTPIPQEDIVKILNAAIQSPSSGNQQPWKFIVLQNSEKIDELRKKSIEIQIEKKKARKKLTNKELNKAIKSTTDYITGFLSAPVYIIVLTDNNSTYPSYNHHDGPIAAGNILLAARALGYGSVYATDSIPVEATKAVCNIPDSYTRVCLIPLGIPVEFPESHGRKNLDNFIINESF